MIILLTFTWSVGLRLADRHVRHLNLVHSRRLEGGKGPQGRADEESLVKDTQVNKPDLLKNHFTLLLLFCVALMLSLSSVGLLDPLTAIFIFFVFFIKAPAVIQST